MRLLGRLEYALSVSPGAKEFEQEREYFREQLKASEREGHRKIRRDERFTHPIRRTRSWRLREERMPTEEKERFC